METSIFKYEDGTNVRIIPLMENETSWFVAVDICSLLGLENSSRALDRIDDDEKTKIDIESNGQTRKVWIVNEFGLYSLILSSEKEEAKIFKRWITHEVLPSIRRTGKYTVDDLKDRDLKINTLMIENERLVAENKDLDAKKKENDKTIKENDKLIKQLIKSDFKQMKLDFK